MPGNRKWTGKDTQKAHNSDDFCTTYPTSNYQKYAFLAWIFQTSDFGPGHFQCTSTPPDGPPRCRPTVLASDERLLDEAEANFRMKC